MLSGWPCDFLPNKTLSCIWVAKPVDWIIYIGMPVVRTVVRSLAWCTVTWLPNFLGSVDYHISLAMGLRPWAGGGVGRTPCTLPLDPPLMHCPGCLNSLVVRIIKRRRINRWINFTYNSLEVACVHPPPPLRKEGGPVRFFLGEGAGLLTLIANRFDTLTVKQWETDKQWCYCFLRPLRKHLTSSSYITLLHGSNLRLELFTTDKDRNCYVKKVCKIPLY